MVSRILQRLIAVVSAFVVLVAATTHLSCDLHAAHAEESPIVSFSFEHVLCDCELCPCTFREASLGTTSNGGDETEYRPILVSAHFHEWSSSNAVRDPRCHSRSVDVLSQHLRFQRMVVLLI